MSGRTRSSSRRINGIARGSLTSPANHIGAVGGIRYRRAVGAWGQCVAAMVAAQKRNGDPAFAVYGIVTDGEVRRVGKLVEP